MPRREKKIPASIKRDVVNPSDYLRLNMPSSCEECSHFSPENESCTLGYPTAPHRRAEQQKSYGISGRIAICRFHEID